MMPPLKVTIILLLLLTFLGSTITITIIITMCRAWAWRVAVARGSQGREATHCLSQRLRWASIIIDSNWGLPWNFLLLVAIGWLARIIQMTAGDNADTHQVTPAGEVEAINRLGGIPEHLSPRCSLSSSSFSSSSSSSSWPCSSSSWSSSSCARKQQFSDPPSSPAGSHSTLVFQGFTTLTQFISNTSASKFIYPASGRVQDSFKIGSWHWWRRKPEKGKLLAEEGLKM